MSAADDLLGDQAALVTAFGERTPADAALLCMAAMAARYGGGTARAALKAELARKPLAKGQVTNLLMEGLHDMLKESGARDPTKQVTELFGEDGPPELRTGGNAASVKRRLRRTKAARKG